MASETEATSFIGNALTWVGDKVNFLSSEIISFLSNSFGVQIQNQIISLLIIGLAIFVVSKLLKSVSKIAIMVLLGIVGVSVLTTIL